MTIPHCQEVNEQERQRLQSMLSYEEGAYQNGYRIIAGVDEAGRGPLAGPVVAAACILPKGMLIAGANDSKKLTAKARKKLFDFLTTHPTVIYGIGIVEAEKIDQINIYQATILAMQTALGQLSLSPDYVLVDGMKLTHPTLSCEGIIKGDQLSLSIAAASIIAKETRDLIMLDHHQKWPVYGFDRHKGYGTAKHIEAIYQHGPCPAHRVSFAPIKQMVSS